MTILNFVTQEQLDNLDEDPRMAFMDLVNHAQRSLAQQTGKFDPDNEYEWRRKQEIEQRFMNVVTAAGKRFEIEPFTTMVIPKNTDYSERDYKQFESDLDHFVTQLILDNSFRSKKTSVEILPNSKDQIRSYLHALKKCVEDAHMDKEKKKLLLDRLADFESELEKRRVSILSISMLAVAIFGAPGTVWASIDITHKLINNITQVIADAKQVEDQARQIGVAEAPKALSPPRPDEPSRPARKAPSQNAPAWQPNQSADLDDDIPF